MAIYMAAVFNADMAIYTAAGPVYMYKISYVHGSNFQSKNSLYTRLLGLHINMAIYTTAVFNAKRLYTLRPGLYNI